MNCNQLIKPTVPALSVFALCQWFVAADPAFAQTTAFTFQGRLMNGANRANGLYDLTFSLFGANTNGSPAAGSLTNAPVLVTNGLFTLTLDFGGPVFDGTPRWLQIGLRTNGSTGPYSILAPRLLVTAAPYAVFALTASTANTATSAEYAGTAINASGGWPLQWPAASITNAPWIATISPTPSNNIPVSLVYSGTNVAVNASLGTHFRLLATNNFLLQNPIGASDAQRLLLEIVQDTTGGRTMTFGSAFKLGTDLPVINLTTNAGLRDFITCVCSGTNFYVVGFMKGF